MPDPTVANRLIGPPAPSRGTDDEVEQLILQELRARFTDSEDPGLARRRRRLAELFDEVQPSRAPSLMGRLRRPRRGDELAERFATLSSPSRAQMMAILERRVRLHQMTVRARRNVRDDPHYIDNAFKEMRRGAGDTVELWLIPLPKPTRATHPVPRLDPFLNPMRATVVESKVRVIVITAAELYQGQRPQLFEKHTIYPDRRTALTEFVAPFTAQLQERGQVAPVVIACYRGPGGLILPTLYTRTSTPRIIATRAELDAIIRRSAEEQERRLQDDARAIANMFRAFYDTFDDLPIPIEVDEEGNASFGTNPVDWLTAGRFKLPHGARAAKGPRTGGGMARLLRRAGRTVRGTAREVGKRIYRQLVKAGHTPAGRGRAISPNLERYPTVRIHPNGDMFGAYDDLTRYLKDAELTGPRTGGATTLEAHHLVEDRLLSPYGIPRDRGATVALESVEHAEMSAELPRWLPRNRTVYDIDEIVLAHERMYIDLGYREFVPRVRRFVREYRDVIRRQYLQRQVPGAKAASFNTRLKRVLDFLDAL